MSLASIAISGAVNGASIASLGALVGHANDAQWIKSSKKVARFVLTCAAAGAIFALSPMAGVGALAAGIWTLHKQGNFEGGERLGGENPWQLPINILAGAALGQISIAAAHVVFAVSRTVTLGG